MIGRLAEGNSSAGGKVLSELGSVTLLSPLHTAMFCAGNLSAVNGERLHIMICNRATRRMACRWAGHLFVLPRCQCYGQCSQASFTLERMVIYLRYYNSTTSTLTSRVAFQRVSSLQTCAFVKVALIRPLAGHASSAIRRR